MSRLTVDVLFRFHDRFRDLNCFHLYRVFVFRKPAYDSFASSNFWPPGCFPFDRLVLHQSRFRRPDERPDQSVLRGLCRLTAGVAFDKSDRNMQCTVQVWKFPPGSMIVLGVRVPN